MQKGETFKIFRISKLSFKDKEILLHYTFITLKR